MNAGLIGGLPKALYTFRRRYSDFGKNGAQDRDRTSDTAIFSRMLYQLSYLGTWPAVEPAGVGEHLTRLATKIKRGGRLLCQKFFYPRKLVLPGRDNPRKTSGRDQCRRNGVSRTDETPASKASCRSGRERAQPRTILHEREGRLGVLRMVRG